MRFALVDSSVGDGKPTISFTLLQIQTFWDQVQLSIYLYLHELLRQLWLDSWKLVTTMAVCLVQWFPTFFMLWPTCRFQQNVVAHHDRTIEISPLSLHLGTNMSKQSMCFTIKHRILFNFSVSNSKQIAR